MASRLPDRKIAIAERPGDHADQPQRFIAARATSSAPLAAPGGANSGAPARSPPTCSTSLGSASDVAQRDGTADSALTFRFGPAPSCSS
jgi:hypothetical protein